MFTKKVEEGLQAKDPYKASKNFYVFACKQLNQIVS